MHWMMEIEFYWLTNFIFIVINSIYLYQEIRCDKYYFASYFLIINSGIIRYPFDCDKFRISLNSYICSCPFIIKLNLPGKQFEAYVSICCILIKEFQEQSIPETIEKDLWCRFHLPHILTYFWLRDRTCNTASMQ